MTDEITSSCPLYSVAARKKIIDILWWWKLTIKWQEQLHFLTCPVIINLKLAASIKLKLAGGYLTLAEQRDKEMAQCCLRTTKLAYLHPYSSLVLYIFSSVREKWIEQQLLLQLETANNSIKLN